VSELTDWQSTFELLRRRIRVILAVPFVAVVATLALSNLWMQPIYEASTVLWVIQTDESALDGARLLFHRNLATTYAEVAKTGHIADKVVAKRPTPPISSQALKKLVKVRQLQAPEMMVISVRHHDPDEAAGLANAYAQGLIEEVQRFTNLGLLQVLEPARPPSKSITPGTAMTATVALTVGLLVGISLAMLLESQSPKPHSEVAL